MTTLAKDTPRAYSQGDVNNFPVVASDIIYAGSAVGLVDASGHARPLTSADKFVGFCEKQADNSAGSAAAIDVEVRKRGRVTLSVTGAVITDVGQPVYATDDNAFQFLKASAVFIGFVSRYVSAGVAEVEYDVDLFKDPHEGLLAETISDNKTLDAEDGGKLFQNTTDAKAFTLLAVEGLSFRIANGAAYGVSIITISPNANDGIAGPDMTSVDDKDLILTKATSRRGDYVDLSYGDATGWISDKMVGTWVKE